MTNSEIEGLLKGVRSDDYYVLYERDDVIFLINLMKELYDDVGNNRIEGDKRREFARRIEEVIDDIEVIERNDHRY